MKCPYCQKEMKDGFVKALGRGGICWVDEKGDWSVPRSDAGFIQLGKAPWLSSYSVPAFNCDSCELIMIDYSALK